MNIWRCELSDKRSAAIRLAFRLLWFGLGFAFMWFFLQPPRGASYSLATAIVYLSIVGYVFDRWKLQHPETSRLKFQWMASLAMLPILAGFQVVFCFCDEDHASKCAAQNELGISRAGDAYA